MSAVASPQSSLGELTALTQTRSWFQGGHFEVVEECREGSEGLGEGEEGKEGERAECGREGKRGKFGE